MSAGAYRKDASLRIAWSGWPYLCVLLISFFVGILGGTLFACFLDPGSELVEYLERYCAQLAQENFRVSFASVLWDCVRWPLYTVALGFTVLGIVGIPVLFAIRGFLLSFSSVTFGLLLGLRGVAVAASLFAVLTLLVLPVLFTLGCDGLRTAYLHLPNAIPTSGKLYRFEIWLVCIGVLAVSVAVQWTVIPAVLRAICSHFAF